MRIVKNINNDWTFMKNMTSVPTTLPEHHIEDMEYILEMGAYTIRLAHYQHDQFFYFDITAPEGRYSLNDTIGDIMKPLAGKIWFLKFFMLLAKKQSGPKEKTAGKKKASTTTQVDKGALDLMKGLTVLRMTSMMGMRNISFTKEELLDLNSQLNKIKRPR